MSNFINLAQAVAMTKKYRDNKENILATKYQGKDILPICETFDRESFQDLLDETDCAYIRVYLGMSENLDIRVIAVAANSKNEDILPSTDAKASALDDGGNIVEDGIRCPTNCPPDSPLNT